MTLLATTKAFTHEPASAAFWFFSAAVLLVFLGQPTFKLRAVWNYCRHLYPKTEIAPKYGEKYKKSTTSEY